MPGSGFREPGGPWRERWITFGGNAQSIAQDAFFDGPPQTITPSSIASAEAFGGAGLDQVTSSLGGIPTQEAFSVLVIDQTISRPSIGSQEAFGVFQFNQQFGAPFILSAEQFSVLVMDRTFLAPGIPSAEAFGVLSIGGQLTLLSIDPPSPQFGVLIVDQPVGVAAIVSGEAFGVVDLQCMISPASIPSGESFPVPGVQMFIGGGAGAPPLGAIASAEAFGSPSVELPDRGAIAAGFTPALDNTDAYGIDLELTAAGDFALRGRGDLARIGGAQNCAQALVLRLRAYPGELPLHIDYGSVLADQLVGIKQLDPQLARSSANAQARQIIEHDRRFLAIKDVTAAFAGPARVAVGMTLRLAGGELVALDDLAETRVDEVLVDAGAVSDTDLELSALDAGLIDYDRDDLGEIPDVDLLTGIST